MTTEALTLSVRAPLWSRLMRGHVGPVAVIVLAIVAVWYLACLPMNWDALQRAMPDAASRPLVEQFVGWMVAISVVPVHRGGKHITVCAHHDPCAGAAHPKTAVPIRADRGTLDRAIFGARPPHEVAFEPA